MKEIDIEKLMKLIDTNYKLLTILVFASAVMRELMNEIGMRLDQTEEYRNESYDWVFTAIENLIYLDKPIPPMPER